MTMVEQSFANITGGIDKLIQEMDKARKYLTQTQSAWAKHTKTVHKGWPATTCHRCLTYKQGIQSNERFLEEAQNEINNFVKQVISHNKG